MRLLLLSYFLLLVAASAFSQNFQFNEYGIEDGMAQNFIYSMDQDAKGYLWIGTGEGLCRYDGQNFKTFTTRDGLAEDVVTSTFIAPNGIVWIGHNSGEISRLKNGKFAKYGDQNKVISTINGLSILKEEMYFVSQNEGLFQLFEGKYERVGKFGASYFYAIQHIDKSNLLLGTDKGVIHLVKSKDRKWIKKKSLFADHVISAITRGKQNRHFFATTKDGILCQLKLVDGNVMGRTWEGEYLKVNELRSVIQDNQMNVWVGTTEKGLIKIPINAVEGDGQEVIFYNTKTGLNSNAIQTIFQDREGSIWVGSFGGGLSSMADDFFTFYEFEKEDVLRNITSILADKEYRWFGSTNGLIRTNINGTNEIEIEFPKNLQVSISDLYQKNGVVYIGTEKSGLFSMLPDEVKAQRVSWDLGTLCNQINQIESNSDFLWVATNGGLISFDLETKGTQVYGIESGLGHNAIQTVLVDKEGDIWIGTFSRFVYKITETGIDQIELIDAGQLQVKSIVEDLDGNIWVASSESGVFKLAKKEITHFSKKNGLASNYIYSLSHDVNNNMWVGHRGALSKIREKDNSVATYDYNFGIQGQVNTRAMSIDKNFDVWIGTENGAIQYDASKDLENELPPIVSLVKVWIDDKAYEPTEEIKLPYGTYRVQFEYIGVSLKDSDKITYRFMLDGHDKVLSDPTKERTATFGSLSDGEYVFQVNAFNSEGVGNNQPTTIRLTIAKPFWKQIWFVLLVGLAFIALVIGFIQYRTARLRKSKELLQAELKEKTKEVVENAQKIHLINKDLTDSINYAERIQNSILPNVDVMREALPNSYLFFQPRDVVSGDFYFIEKINNKLIIACADCTGHGVPGAFVSMIGAVTLRNIYSLAKYQWKTPDQVLEELDEEIQHILHREEYRNETSVSLSKTDGMDISLCEIDLDTKEVLIASAKRTSLVKKDGKFERLKGDNRSIGGLDLMKTRFSLTKLQLNKGDALYMFTDGFTDQFGGIHDKKLMISGLLEMLDALEGMKPELHPKAIRSNFALWRSGTPQIDDVLFIALQF